MKVLLSAIACDPYLVTENYGGWAAMQTLARDHDVWVLTSGRNRPDLERAAAEERVPQNVRFVYAGRFKEWHPNRIRARFQAWTEYFSFCRALLEPARELHRAVGFDVAHHVTYATWRGGSTLWKLGVPFVFGPIGGNETFPLRLLPVLSRSAAGFELFRTFSTVFSRRSPSVRACLRRAAHVFVANADTERLVRTIRGSPNGVSRLMQVFYSTDEIEAFVRAGAQRTLTGPLRLFASGYLEGRKGIALALEALARVKASGVDFRYWVGKNGPELAHLQQLARRLSLQDQVTFGFLPKADYQKELGATHLFFLPSLRDSLGVTLMEAMLAGCVPVVADCGGPAYLVTDECGFKIPVTNRHQMVEDLADTLLTLDRNREILLTKGAAAARRIATLGNEDHYHQTVNSVYRAVVKSGGE